jgi:hypothetical protein
LAGDVDYGKLRWPSFSNGGEDMTNAARICLAVTTGALFALPAGSGIAAPDGSDLTPRRYPNCKTLNRYFPHGVGRLGARDRTKSGDPVTNFKRSNRLYELNRGLDRDKDRVACEKK